MAHGEQTRSESVEVFSASAVSGFVLFGQFLPIGTKLETSFNVNKHVTSTSKDGNASYRPYEAKTLSTV